MDDNSLRGGQEMTERLDLCLDILQLADMWHITELQSHVETCLLKAKNVFIRPETVLNIRNIARDVNSARVFEYCESYFMRNKNAVEAVASSNDEEESDSDCPTVEPSA